MQGALVRVHAETGEGAVRVEDGVRVVTGDGAGVEELGVRVGGFLKGAGEDTVSGGGVRGARGRDSRVSIRFEAVGGRGVGHSGVKVGLTTEATMFERSRWMGRDDEERAVVRVEDNDSVVDGGGAWRWGLRTNGVYDKKLKGSACTVHTHPESLNLTT